LPPVTHVSHTCEPKFSLHQVSTKFSLHQVSSNGVSRQLVSNVEHPAIIFVQSFSLRLNSLLLFLLNHQSGSMANFGQMVGRCALDGTDQQHVLNFSASSNLKYLINQVVLKWKTLKPDEIVLKYSMPDDPRGLIELQTTTNVQNMYMLYIAMGVSVARFVLQVKAHPTVPEPIATPTPQFRPIPMPPRRSGVSHGRYDTIFILIGFISGINSLLETVTTLKTLITTYRMCCLHRRNIYVFLL
jgi:hypothetical protein